MEIKKKKQKCVTKDSIFAEYTPLSEAVYESIFIKEVVRTFNVRIDKSIKIYKDNSGTINIAKYGNFTKNSKHIEIHYHYIHKYIEENTIDVIKIKSDKNIADIFTKSLCKEKYEKFGQLMNVKWKEICKYKYSVQCTVYNINVRRRVRK